ncbi:hypothetical protein GJ688_02115 [Heliobacillus mobilis]|uniref:Uncharacterized protein n=1 Tax=Heliobacterium mobile TaxID=28064 RepID=A0A6I3SBQ4_HELMO|nr:hypothetical protein [Heliobacterium mobile]MTV47778.1 hypothetical protein [Heliobacterium mobile]
MNTAMVKNPLFISALAAFVYSLLAKSGVIVNENMYHLAVDTLCAFILGYGVYSSVVVQGDTWLDKIKNNPKLLLALGALLYWGASLFGVQLDPTLYRDFLNLMSIALLGTGVMTNWDQWQVGKPEFSPEQFIPIVDKPVVKAEEKEPATFAQAGAPSDTPPI